MSINISPSRSQASARSITEMGNLNHGAGRGSPMVNLYNGKELDQNPRTAEMAGGPEDICSANARESYSHKDAQNNPVSSRPSRRPVGHLGTEVPAGASGDGCSGGGQVGDTSRGDLSENERSKNLFLSPSAEGGGWMGDQSEEGVGDLLAIALPPGHAGRAPEVHLYT